MCGIAGITGTINQEEARAKVGRMLKMLEHRGPNDAGLEVFAGGATLGHRRLSIFDLSAAGHQPMLADDRQTGVVFNGAIYNFRALRRELEQTGRVFRSRTDTEVLLHGYEIWGFDRLVEKIEGMFAIGLWDARAEKLFLVRDRLGVKPLCFARRGAELAFASTVRALNAADPRGFDEKGLAEYLEFGFLTDETSIYEGIEKVRAGEIVEWHAGEIKRRLYWDLSTEPDDDAMTFDEAVEETERLFLEAVEKRLQADVPIGALLSGGIDSSLVCWAITKLGGDVTAFTVGTPNDPHDESSVAVRTAQKLGIRHEVLALSGEKPPNIDELVRAYAEPFACASALGMLSISREVKKQATVLLTGDGGDDVFLGYPEHKHFFMSGKLARAVPDFTTDLWLKTRRFVPPVGNLKRAVSFFDYSFGGLAAVGNARDGLPVYRRHNLLGERLKDVSLAHREMKWSVASGRNLLSEFLAYDRRTRFVGEYLPKVDGGTMMHALEARSPFLDTRLWEFAARLPFSLRLREGRSKAILRELVARRIGRSLAEGKKQGFIIPVQRWLAGDWRASVRETLADSLLEKEGWIETGPTLALLDRAAEQNWAPRQLWFIYVLESWLRYEKDLRQG